MNGNFFSLFKNVIIELLLPLEFLIKHLQTKMHFGFGYICGSWEDHPVITIRFAQDFLQRMQTPEKGRIQYKYPDCTRV